MDAEPRADSPNVSVRHASAADAPGIASCLQCAFEPYETSYTPDAYRETVPTPAGILERMQSMTTFVACTRDGQIVGSVFVEVRESSIGHLRGMSVHPAFQGTGVADRLMDTAEQDLRDRRCRAVTLDTTAPLMRAIRFYERRGYRRSGRVSDYFGMDLFEYVKTL